MLSGRDSKSSSDSLYNLEKIKLYFSSPIIISKLMKSCIYWISITVKEGTP